MGVIAYTAILWRRVRGDVCGSACIPVLLFTIPFPLRPPWLDFQLCISLFLSDCPAYCAKNSKFAMLGSSRFSSRPNPYVPTMS